MERDDSIFFDRSMIIPINVDADLRDRLAD